METTQTKITRAELVRSFPVWSRCTVENLTMPHRTVQGIRTVKRISQKEIVFTFDEKDFVTGSLKESTLNFATGDKIFKDGDSFIIQNGISGIRLKISPVV